MIRRGTSLSFGFTNALATLIGTVEAFISTIHVRLSSSLDSLAMTSTSAVAGIVRVVTRLTLAWVYGLFKE